MTDICEHCGQPLPDKGAAAYGATGAVAVVGRTPVLSAIGLERAGFRTVVPWTIEGGRRYTYRLIGSMVEVYEASDEVAE